MGEDCPGEEVGVCEAAVGEDLPSSGACEGVPCKVGSLLLVHEGDPSLGSPAMEVVEKEHPVDQDDPTEKVSFPLDQEFATKFSWLGCRCVDGDPEFLSWHEDVPEEADGESSCRWGRDLSPSTLNDALLENGDSALSYNGPLTSTVDDPALSSRNDLS